MGTEKDQQPKQCLIFPIAGQLLRPSSSGGVLKLDPTGGEWYQNPHGVWEEAWTASTILFPLHGGHMPWHLHTSR